ncbi:hypothetical protein WA026_001936 [Henosepilachna vigintioctopunctata]|uniref:Pacifastin domain-containing protein n=1 Tax=Henosepilachna vigintioctopunctata TaxID=420089 RepID=A0AAW1UTC4_9CUCU
MQVLTLMLIMFQLTKNLLTDCIPGETWFEKCRKCTCKSNKRPVCVSAKCNSIGKVLYRFIIGIDLYSIIQLIFDEVNQLGEICNLKQSYYPQLSNTAEMKLHQNPDFVINESDFINEF